MDSVDADIIRGVDAGREEQSYTLDKQFVPNPAHMVVGVELREGKLYEVNIKAGESWTQKKYREMNELYQKTRIKTSFAHWLSRTSLSFSITGRCSPSTFVQEHKSEYNTLNGGTIAASHWLRVDEWIGQIVKEVDKLGIAENTIIVVMGDNGPFMQYVGRLWSIRPNLPRRKNRALGRRCKG